MSAVNRLRTRARDDSKRVQISLKYYAIITTRYVIFPELGRSRASTEVAIRRQCGFIYRLVKYIVLFYRYYAAFRRSPPSCFPLFPLVFPDVRPSGRICYIVASSSTAAPGHAYEIARSPYRRDDPRFHRETVSDG